MPLHPWNRLSSVLAVGLLASATTLLAGSSHFMIGPNWEECLDDPEGEDCDAGNTIQSAQKVRGNGNGEIRQISGETKGESGFMPGIEGDWQDIYAIFISKPENFQASTLANAGGFAEFNTMLWLFSNKGSALLANNDAGPGETGSFLLNESSNGGISLQDIGPGIYYIAISGFDSSPRTENLQDMFPVPLPDGLVSGPTQDGFENPLGSWFPETTPLENGAYVIRFSANSVTAIPYSCGEVESGSCYTENGSPGCDKLQCCTKICFEDPFCCDVVWDLQCANLAIEKCITCGNPSSGPCETANGSPFCQDAACCKAVCDVDPNCCINEWDLNCALMAQKICGLPCSGKCPGDFNDDGLVDGGDLGLMLARWEETGCGDLNGDGQIDGGDIGLLLSLFGSCSTCGRSNTGDCYQPSEFVGCEDEACCKLVCNNDPFCCNTDWDGMCAKSALKSCLSCGNPTNGTCFEMRPDPFCNDETCCESVCAIDPSCCTANWDTNCVNLALQNCTGTCGNPNAGPCDIEHPSPGCDNEACCRAVCEILPRCCEILWDSECAQMSLGLPACN